jgi:formylglycine-generating enzyme required for sulfatase activity
LAAEIEARLSAWAPPEPEGELRTWERLRDEIEAAGFRGGVRDVLHFGDEEAQLAAWWQLAEITDDPDQAAIDAYLRELAPEGMVYVPAGPFLMGSTEDDPEADADEKPQHEVELPGYYIGRYPVTNAAYAEFIEAGGYETREYWTEAGWNWKWRRRNRAQPNYWDDENRNQLRQPVVGVSWYEAVAYCRWRGLRLPTEAEWEKAAGWEPVGVHPRGRPGPGGRKRRYPWGNEWDEGKIRSFDQGQPVVGEFTREADNTYGVSDMAGLYTWCSTRWWDEEGNDYTYLYDSGDGRENLSGGDDVLRVLRGSYGSTSEKAAYARCADRYWGDPGFWDNSNVGLRLSAPRCLLPPGSES